MNTRNLNKIHRLAKYPMTAVMAQAWFMSTKCRHAVRGRGLLRIAGEDQA